MQPILGVPFMILAFASVSASAQTDPRAQAPVEAQASLKRLIPGEEFLPAAMRAQQADDFDNPAFPFVEAGEAAFSRPEGAAGKSCQDCHGAGEKNWVRHAAASYPKYLPRAKQVISLQQRINICRQNGLQASPYPETSDQMTAMTAYLRWLSRGLPPAVDVSGPAAPTFERGRELYHMKTGLLQLSCAQCHDLKFGQKFGAETVSQGHPQSYPVFSVGERRMISLHERFRMCNQLTRAEPQPVNAPDYVALELYISWRSKDLPITAPGVRP
ncbi:MAG: sulfur oxidation c-type cytochrome SoxA [Rhodomicrobium sp.]